MESKPRRWEKVWQALGEKEYFKILFENLWGLGANYILRKANYAGHVGVNCTSSYKAAQKDGTCDLDNNNLRFIKEGNFLDCDLRRSLLNPRSLSQ
jgi:hypothetical protein